MAGYSVEDVETDAPIAGVGGPGRWLLFCYEPVALFSLKASSATSSVGRSLVVPTPYAVKMSLVEAALRSRWGGGVDEFVLDLARTRLRIGVPQRATVTHTIVKIRQAYEEKGKKEERTAGGTPPYKSAVAYREYVHFQGSFKWAFDLATMSERCSAALVALAPRVSYIGKRGGFIQYAGVCRQAGLSSAFTQPVLEMSSIPDRAHIAFLDDFGPEANLDALNSYTSAPIKRGRHRVFVETVVPFGVDSVGPGFTEYVSAGLKNGK